MRTNYIPMRAFSKLMTEGNG